MSSEKGDIDEIGRRMLEPLRTVPPLDEQAAAKARQHFLLHADSLRNEQAARSARVLPASAGGKITGLFAGKPLPLMRVLVGALVALIILVGSSATVYAAQSSLPGEPLYVIKSLSEDFRMTLTSSPQARLELTLNYTDRRMDEITSLVSEGEQVSNQASSSFEGELEDALMLAAQMGDEDIKLALGQIRQAAQTQGITLEELVSKMPEQANPAILRLRDRIQEQVRLSSMGEIDPQTYRFEIRERQREKQDMNPASGADKPSNLPPNMTATCTPTAGKDKPGNDSNKPSNPPGQENVPPGQDGDNPGNGNQLPSRQLAP
jgi:Domain of unknown function (DUF5667)